MTVADPTDAVFAPAISARTCVVVRKVFPRGAAGAVVLSDRSPLPLGKIRAPALPIFLPCLRLFEPPVFGCQQSRHGSIRPSATSIVAFPVRTEHHHIPT